MGLLPRERERAFVSSMFSQFGKHWPVASCQSGNGQLATSNYLNTLPSFITKRTSLSTSMLASGSPLTATMSA